MKRVFTLLIVLSLAFVTAMANSPPVEKATPTTITFEKKAPVEFQAKSVTTAPVTIRLDEWAVTQREKQFNVTATGDFRGNWTERFTGLALENRARADPN